MERTHSNNEGESNCRIRYLNKNSTEKEIWRQKKAAVKLEHVFNNISITKMFKQK